MVSPVTIAVSRIDSQTKFYATIQQYSKCLQSLNLCIVYYVDANMNAAGDKFYDTSSANERAKLKTKIVEAFKEKASKPFFEVSFDFNSLALEIRYL